MASRQGLTIIACLCLCVIQTSGKASFLQQVELSPSGNDGNTVHFSNGDNAAIRAQASPNNANPDAIQDSFKVDEDGYVAKGFDENDAIDPAASAVKFEETFQGCMMHCLESELCCSCTEKGKKSMTAALVNELTNACALSDINACAEQWIRSVLTSDKRGGASNCTQPDSVASNINVCASRCSGRPFSKPLNLKDPDIYQGHLTDFTNLSELPDVDLTEFCEDLRAEGLLCTMWRSDSFTAGNTHCRPHNRCGYHGYTYSWCYVDWSNHWDYCCTGDCGFGQETDYMWCQSGKKWQYCGDAGTHDINDRQCVANYPCGMHQENGKASYYWCYTDLRKNWDHCCQPWHKCGKHGYSYDWCYTGYKKKTDWKHCVP